MNVVTALQPLAEALEVNGYELRADVTGERAARVEVVASEGVCADCLVPKEMFGGMVVAQLKEQLSESWTVEVLYPADQP